MKLRPMVRRRLVVRSDSTLAELHHVLGRMEHREADFNQPEAPQPATRVKGRQRKGGRPWPQDTQSITVLTTGI